MSLTWDGVLAFVQEHEHFLLPIAFAISMAESIIGVSLLVPSTFILIAGSTVMGASGANIALLWVAAGLGAATGDWISYSLGYFSEARLRNSWPLRGNPDLWLRGHAFFERWGWASMFIARFMGPLRSLTPLIAGVCRMPLLVFGIASFFSAFMWAGAVLAPSGFGAGWILGP